MASSYTALLFDMDGTVANSDGLHLRGFQHLLELGDIQLPQHLGSKLDAAFFSQHCAGRTSKMILEGVFGITEPEHLARLTAKKEQRFIELVQTDLHPLPGLDVSPLLTCILLTSVYPIRLLWHHATHSPATCTITCQ